MEKEKGLFDKYTVIKNETGQPIDNFAFILVPEKDPAAVTALQAYAKATDNSALANDLEVYLDSLCGSCRQRRK